jgi:hypothetical protein
MKTRSLIMQWNVIAASKGALSIEITSRSGTFRVAEYRAAVMYWVEFRLGG